ncbi:MAG: acetyl-CoA carboxylase biotin carboxyl carrier protein [Mariprofundaceae bacterium]|nr:acetyl-CoA carboxylase biotin carboxyl carrier protein [Mariprofundaceae bacterium]
MDISEIRKLIRLVQASDITEIEVSEGDNTIRISRQSMAAAPVAMPQVMAAPVAAAPIAHAAPSLIPASESAEQAENAEHVFKSPMVGTFYASSSPDADAFVSVGTQVKTGDVLCIVEAMKLMNEIEAEYDGVVEEVLVKNAQPLEYGQPIFVITPA